MIESIVSLDMKSKMSDEIAAKTEAFLASGEKVSEVDFGVGKSTIDDAYRKTQSNMAVIDAAAKAAKVSRKG